MFCLIKCSICIMLIRIFSAVRPFKIAAHVVMASCITLSAISTLTILLICTPVSNLWNIRAPKEHCRQDRRLALISAYAVNVVTEVMIWCLPVPIVWRLRLPRAQKIALSAIFGLGIMYVTVFLNCPNTLPFLSSISTLFPHMAQFVVEPWSEA